MLSPQDAVCHAPPGMVWCNFFVIKTIYYLSPASHPVSRHRLWVAGGSVTTTQTHSIYTISQTGASARNALVTTSRRTKSGRVATHNGCQPCGVKCVRASTTLESARWCWLVAFSGHYIIPVNERNRGGVVRLTEPPVEVGVVEKLHQRNMGLN